MSTRRAESHSNPRTSHGPVKSAAGSPAGSNPRSRFASNIGFVLSGIGAAVGLGSFWRFPQLTSQNGGGAFVFVFILMLVVFGVPLLWAEMAIGQRAQRSSVDALDFVAGRSWRIVGVLFVTSSFLILGYYTILAGMVLKYTLFSFGSSVVGDPSSYLDSSREGVGALGFGILAAATTGGIVALGVAKGLERANLVMMPALFLMLLGLVIYALAQPGAQDGLDFYLSIDFAEITPDTFLVAIGQVFFAVGIGFGIMLTYASYTPPGRTLLPSSIMVNGSILVVGFLAGLMVFPLVFSQGLAERVIDPDAGGTTTLFLTMPTTFASIGGGLGRFLMFLFFLMLFFAALSSTISALEVLVSYARDSLGWSRVRGNLIATEYYFIPGVFAAASEDVFVWVDTFLSSVLLVGAVFALCLVYTFAVKNREDLLLAGLKSPTPFQWMAARATAIITAYVAPAALAVIFVLALPATIGALF